MDRPLRIAYFDLGFSREQYGLQPTRYGGGAVAARYLKEDPEIEFHVFAPQEAFDNVSNEERWGRCVVLPEFIQRDLKHGRPVTDVLAQPFDLILHGHTCFALNRGSYRGPMVHWSGFDGSAGHPGNDYVLLYDPSFKAQFGERAKYVRIGKPVPPSCPPRKPGDYVVQVSRHDDHMNSIALAKRCLEHGIKGVFAGPIHNAYPLMDYVDGKTTIYLGEITEVEKLALYHDARLFGLLFNWSAPFNQSVIEAQGQGCPIYTLRRGPFLTSYLQHDVNGFNADLISLPEAFEAAGKVDYSQACWRAARQYDVSVMVESFKTAFREIVAEWQAEHLSL